MDEPEKTLEGMKTPKNFVEKKYMWIHICTHSGVMCQVSEKNRIDFWNVIILFHERAKRHGLSFTAQKWLI